jgi:hypothetical protein
MRGIAAFSGWRLLFIRVCAAKLWKAQMGGYRASLLEKHLLARRTIQFPWDFHPTGLTFLVVFDGRESS